MPDDSKPKRPSGGKRAVAKKHAERAAERNRDAEYLATLRAQYEQLGAPPEDPRKVHEWLARAAAQLCAEGLNDFALPPEQRRRHAMQLIRWAVDTLDGAKLATELRELYDALREGKPDDAAPLATRDVGVCASSTDLL